MDKIVISPQNSQLTKIMMTFKEFLFYNLFVFSNDIYIIKFFFSAIIEGAFQLSRAFDAKIYILPAVKSRPAILTWPPFTVKRAVKFSKSSWVLDKCISSQLLILAKQQLDIALSIELKQYDFLQVLLLLDIMDALYLL